MNTPDSSISPLVKSIPQDVSAGEAALASGAIQVEKKIFEVALKENHRGRYLWIAEYTGQKRNRIMVPESALKQFQLVLEDMLAVQKTEARQTE